MRKHWENRQQAIETALASIFEKTEKLPQRGIFAAMEYSLLAGGKRLRPVLFLEFAALGGCVQEDAMPFACALEMIHTYSLIHDDLPCMDDDDMRRGKPTCHKQFGEALAVLAGDGLLTAAFAQMLSAPTNVSAENRLAAASQIADAAGVFGMIGGQVLDIENETAKPSVSRLEQTNRLKTGALFAAACQGGLLLAGEKNKEKLAAAAAYADHLGQAFQIRDDILDIAGSHALLGKETGGDVRQGKETFASLWGISAAEKAVKARTAGAVAALSAFEGAEFLAFLAKEQALRAF